MNILFLHQNFPGQYKYLAHDLAAKRGNKVAFLTQPNKNQVKGVRKVVYEVTPPPGLAMHQLTLDFDVAVRTGAAAADACLKLKAEGFEPDIIIGHAGWGETLFMKDVFPNAPVLADFEFYYHYQGADVGFDPEFTSVFNDPRRLRVRNAVLSMALQSADWGHAATRWQRDLYPPDMRRRLSVIHEGIDTDTVKPNPKATLQLTRDNIELTCKDEVITYVARNLEPYRGFHVFMRALPEILKRRPKAHAIIVGGDGVSYGAPAPPGSSFRKMLLEEVGDKLDMKRVHFLGQIPYVAYLKVLQVSSVHIYLTYPFVLSWSFIEAMSAGCLVIGSTTAPVLEVLKPGVNGLGVEFFDRDKLISLVDEAIENPKRMQAIRRAARQTAIAQFDLKRLQLPKWRKLVADLVGGKRPNLG